jgi:hypothetical protein
MLPSRFTVIMDFQGGTYVSQVEARDYIEATRLWAERFAAERPVPRLSGRLAKKVLADLNDNDNPTLLDGLTDVWCFGAVVGGSLVLANIVRSRL